MPTHAELLPLAMSRAFIASIIESEAQDRYGYGAEEFVRRVSDGTLDESSGAADLIFLARSLGQHDPLGLPA